MAETARKPWWAAALLGGIGMGAGAVVALGLGGVAQGREPSPARVAVAGMAIQGQQDEVKWRERIDAKLAEVAERLARIEGRLDRGDRK